MPAAEVVVELADGLFAAIERGDEARLEELFDSGIAVWRAGARRDDDKQRALKVLRFRTLVYSASVKLRTGVDRGPEAPAT